MAVIKDKILVIEDEKSINYLIGTVLTANGYDVIKAYTGTEACQMLDAYCPDLIILDLGLPDMDGVDIIRRIRGWSVVPIIVVSARTRERDKIEALDLGADDYLTKPFGGGYAGKVLTYDFIIREIWGPNAVGDTQNLRANMAKIRRKLEKNPAKPQYIFTEVGVGYRMAEGD